MKTNKTQLALIVAAALLAMAKAEAKAEVISINSQFTPLENLSVEDRAIIQDMVEKQNPFSKLDWEKSILGKDEDGKIEVRDKDSLKLMAHIEPTCS